MPSRILIVNGPNLNKLGEREPEIYGKDTLADIEKKCGETAKFLGLTADCWQSNVEGEIVTKIQDAPKTYQGANGPVVGAVRIHQCPLPVRSSAVMRR